MLVHFNLRPGTRQLRQFGWIAFVAFGVLGLTSIWKGSLLGLSLGSAAIYVAGVLWAAGVLSALFSLAWPEGNRPLFVSLVLITFPIGWVVSYVVLAILFYAILTPVGLVFRILGRDPLMRSFDSAGDSYWQDLPEVDNDRDYFRQF